MPKKNKADQLSIFKANLEKAAGAFGVAPHKVNAEQYYHVNNVASGDVGRAWIRLFGFGKLKNACYPPPDFSRDAAKEIDAMLLRIAKMAGNK